MRKLLFLLMLNHAQGALLSPHNNAHLNHIYVLFEWEQIPETNEYQLQIAENSDFTTNMNQINKSILVHIERDLIDWNKTYYWRLRPNYVSGPGTWSETFSFTTGQPLSSSTSNITDIEPLSPGITVFGAFFNYFSAAIDQDGREIWNSGLDDFVYYSTNTNGNLLGCHLLSGAENNLPGSEMSFDGDTIWSEPNNEFLHHDIIQLPNGNYLGIVETSSLGFIPIGDWTSLYQGLGFQADGVTVEFPWIGDKLVEWDKDTKEVVWSWNTFDYFDMSDFDQFGGTWTEAYISMHYDWTHVNAVIFDEEESCLYISVRHLSRITKIDYPSGDIIWNIGHDMPSGDVEMGNELGFSFQHSLQKLSNGNLLTFDNGNLAPEFRGTDEPVSRAIEISIENSEASLAWSHELTPDLFGFASGNAQKLENGNVLLTTVGGGGRSVEVNTNGDIVWEGLYNLSLPDGAVYRANRLPGIYPLAYSVMVEGLNEYNGDIGVYLPVGTSNLNYQIHNEGSHPISLACVLTDDLGWFSPQPVYLNINPGANQTLTFQGNITSIEGANLMTLAITPQNHENKLRTISFDGFTAPLTMIDNIHPATYQLTRPYPNPFNPSTRIEFQIEENYYVTIQVYGVKGQLIETLLEKKMFEGKHSINWDAKNNAAGVYFIVMKIADTIQSHKVILLK